MSSIPPISDVRAEILRLLLSDGEMYGLELVLVSPMLKKDTIYITLQRMEDAGLVTSRQDKIPSEAGPPRRMFKATAYAERLMRAYQAAQAAFASVMGSATGPALSIADGITSKTHDGDAKGTRQEVP